ncbi:MAG: hypothetical protein ACKO37_03910 [Vampirovibrionales bacterium]
MIASFFDYTCDACQAPVCERVSILNLTLDIEDILYCLPCLTRLQEDIGPDSPLSLEQVMTLRALLLGYVEARDCFNKPWSQFKAQACPLPRIETQTLPSETASWHAVCFCRPEAG